MSPTSTERPSFSLANQRKQDPVTSFRDQLLAEEPKIDQALKRFCSWLVSASNVAHLLSDEGGGNDDTNDGNDNEPVVWTLVEALKYTRSLSKAINGHIAPITPLSSTTTNCHHDDRDGVTPDSLMHDISIQVWNNVASQQPGVRLTKMLGRTALRHVWQDLDWPVDDDLDAANRGQVFRRLFGKLLLLNDKMAEEMGETSLLIWGGPNVLHERALRRQAAAAQRVDEQQQTLREAVSTPVIQELPTDDDDESNNADANPPAV
jgi:hypothetical protein